MWVEVLNVNGIAIMFVKGNLTTLLNIDKNVSHVIAVDAYVWSKFEYMYRSGVKFHLNII